MTTLAARCDVKKYSASRREPYHGHLGTSETCRSVHSQRNCDVGVSVAICSVADVAFGKCVDSDSVTAWRSAVVPRLNDLAAAAAAAAAQSRGRGKNQSHHQCADMNPGMSLPVLS